MQILQASQLVERGNPKSDLWNPHPLRSRVGRMSSDRRIIHSDPEIMSGTPVYVGMRVPLQTFFDYLEGEAGLAEFLEDFPHL
ncbi:MAG: DUF433 domain-containing protein [Nostoc sp.]